MSKVYVIDARYYIQADNEDELREVLDETGVIYNEYYGGYDIVRVEDED